MAWKTGRRAGGRENHAGRVREEVMSMSSAPWRRHVGRGVARMAAAAGGKNRAPAAEEMYAGDRRARTRLQRLS